MDLHGILVYEKILGIFLEPRLDSANECSNFFGNVIEQASVCLSWRAPTERDLQLMHAKAYLAVLLRK